MKQRLNSNKMNIFFYSVTMLAAIACVVPVLFVLSISLTSEDQILKNGYRLLPESFTLDAYTFVFRQAKSLLTAYKISVLVTVIGTFLSVLVTSLMAYPMSRSNFTFRKGLSFYVYFTMLFTGGIVPTYIVISRISRFFDIKDSLFVLIFPILVPAFHVLLLRNFFSTLPNEIIESARVDGAGEFFTFLKIVIPLSLPGIATIGLFSSLMYWNDWFNAMLYIESSSKYPIQYLLQKIMNSVDFIKNNSNVIPGSMQIPQESIRMALCIIVMGPIILAYPFFQKYFVKGLTIGAVKG